MQPERHFRALSTAVTSPTMSTPEKSGKIPEIKAHDNDFDPFSFGPTAAPTRPWTLPSLPENVPGENRQHDEVRADHETTTNPARGVVLKGSAPIENLLSDPLPEAESGDVCSQDYTHEIVSEQRSELFSAPGEAHFSRKHLPPVLHTVCGDVSPRRPKKRRTTRRIADYDSDASAHLDPEHVEKPAPGLSPSHGGRHVPAAMELPARNTADNDSTTDTRSVGMPISSACHPNVPETTGSRERQVVRRELFPDASMNVSEKEANNSMTVPPTIPDIDWNSVWASPLVDDANALPSSTGTRPGYEMPPTSATRGQPGDEMSLADISRRHDELLTARRLIIPTSCRNIQRRRASIDDSPCGDDVQSVSNAASSIEQVWEREVRRKLSMLPVFFSSREAKLQDETKVRKGVLAYQGIPLTKRNNCDVRYIHDLEYAAKEIEGKPCSSYEQVCCVTG